jgi:hypothetical protein
MLDVKTMYWKELTHGSLISQTEFTNWPYEMHISIVK